MAAEFPQLCEAETAAFAELLGTHVQRLATIAHGDAACTTHIPHAAVDPIRQPRLGAPAPTPMEGSPYDCRCRAAHSDHSVD